MMAMRSGGGKVVLDRLPHAVHQIVFRAEPDVPIRRYSQRHRET